MNERELVLASQSPRRRLLLMAHGYNFTVVPLQISEIPDENLNLQRRIERLALDKVEACIKLRRRLGQSSNAVILTADTVVALDGQVLGKPQSDGDAHAMLKALSGRSHQVLSAVALHDEVTGETICDHEVSRVYFHPLNSRQISDYVASGEGRDKAGSYGIQGRAAEFVERFEGSFDNVVGLPMALVERMIRTLAEKGSFSISYRSSAMATRARTIEQRVSQACLQAGRKRESVRWIGVSKTKPLVDILEAQRAGICEFGENYAQEAVAKLTERLAISQALGFRSQSSNWPVALSEPASHLVSPPQWHFIGHLQSNKVKSIAGQFNLIHSVDRMSLVDELQKQSRALDHVQDILVQVNYGDEETKSGLQLSVGIDEVENFIRQAEAKTHLRVRGLMALPPLQSSSSEARRQFADLRRLFDELCRRRSTEHRAVFDTLSMGTTGDFESAILEGSTLLRIGTALFGERS